MEKASNTAETLNPASDPDAVQAGQGIASEEASKQSDQSSNGYLRVFTYNDTIGWVTTAVAVVCMIASGVLLPLMNIVFGIFVTVFNGFITGEKTPDEFRSDINHYTLYFVYLFVAKFALSYIWTTLISINAIRITRALRISFLRQTLRQEMGFFDAAGAGAVAATLNAGGNTVAQGVAEKLGLAVQAATTFVAAFVVAFAVQWKLTLITMCIVPAILVVISICVALDMAVEGKLTEAWGRADRLAEEAFASIRDVHAFWAFPKMARKYEDITLEAKRLAARKPPLYAVMFCVQFFCIYAGYALAFWQGTRMYASGEIKSPGDVVTVILAVLLAAQGLTQIAPQLMVVGKASAAAAELFQTIDRASKIDAFSTSGAAPPSCRGDIAFSGVVFAYPSRPSVAVLPGLDLAIPAHKTTALVGASGSGKSTVVGLIERWFDPDGGAVTLDGHRIDELNVRWLRTNVRLVQQEPVLFAGTVLQNVANGLAGTPQAALDDSEKAKLVEAACRAAHAHEFIEKLPNGYHTAIGERGSLLSGGQKQRLAIARAVISDPRVLLLDEATSALDATSEHLVQQALNSVAVGRTVLVIAHRLSTVRDADSIAVLHKGVVVEQGTHEELMRKEGRYERLVRAQDLGRERRGGREGSGEPSLSAEDTKALAGDPSAACEQPADVEQVKDEAALNYGLLKCLAMIVMEQKSLWFPFAVIAVTAVIGGGTYPALAVLFSRALDAFALSGDAILSRGSFYALMFFVMALGNLASYFAMGWCSCVVSQSLLRTYRLALFDSALRQPMAFFDGPSASAGALAARLATEPDALQDLLSSNAALILTIAVNLVSSCALAIATGWKLGLVLAFGALPVLVGAGFVRVRLECHLDDATAARFAASAGIASEAVRAMRTVSSLALEDEVLARYEASLGSIATAAVRSVVPAMAWYALSQSASFLAMALGFWYGGRLVAAREYTAGQFYTAFVAVVFAGEAAAALFTYTSSVAKARGAANYIFALARSVGPDLRDDLPPPLPPAPPGSEIVDPAAAASVECRSLTFAYPSRPATSVLRAVSLAARPGQFVALVGASGCGKSTMVGLLERFYEPTSGTLLVDGADAGRSHLARHRRAIALVAQEPVLYDGSLRENIALGGVPDDDGDGATDAAILEACRLADIDALVASLPEGLGTACGARGVRFSGGQRQRIAIARALLRRPRLLLLDEATSSLDSESERAVQTALDKAARGGGGGEGGGGGARTTVAVAHRLATVRDADVIFVFDEGRVVEVGSHDELVQMGGVYYQMVLAQSLD